MACGVITPVVVIIPIVVCAAEITPNQRLPSEPTVIPLGKALAGGMFWEYLVIAWVLGSIFPIARAARSVNQRLPSGPAVISWGWDVEARFGDEYSVIWPFVGLIIPILPRLDSV